MLTKGGGSSKSAESEEVAGDSGTGALQLMGGPLT